MKKFALNSDHRVSGRAVLYESAKCDVVCPKRHRDGSAQTPALKHKGRVTSRRSRVSGLGHEDAERV